MDANPGSYMRVVLHFDGEWVNENRLQWYKVKSSQIITISTTITYAELLQYISLVIGISDVENDIELKYQVIMAQGPCSPLSIKSDVDVSHFIQENLSGPRLPICITYKKKTIRLNSIDEQTRPLEVRSEYESNNFMPLGTPSDDCNLKSTPDILNQPVLNARASDVASGNHGMQGDVEPGVVTEYVPPIAKDSVFLSKELLKQALVAYALSANIQFKVLRSTRKIYVVGCLDNSCQWYVRSTRMKESDCFQIRVLRETHSCTVDSFEPDHRQASSSHIGLCIKQNLEDVCRVYTPKDIVQDIRREYGINISYSKAWRGREYALNVIRGSPEESYAELPLYFAILKEKNPGTVTHIETDVNNHFKYSFMAIGASIRGFQACMRPVIAVDATFLKAKYRGSLFVATCMDGNNQVYPLCWGVADSENDASWTWFFQRLEECISQVPGLVFVSDRNKSIEKGIRTVFTTSKHVACMYHLGQNLMAKFKNEALRNIFYNAAKAFRTSEFNRCMREIFAIDNQFGSYLVEAGYEKWARSRFDGDRFTIMTTNIAECLNAILKSARTLPITPLMEYLRDMMQRWYYERRNFASGITTELTPWAEDLINKSSNKSTRYSVTPINADEYVVDDGFFSPKVSFADMTCECRKWQVIKLPCGHAIAASRKRRSQIYPLCPSVYSSNCLRMAYCESIYPVGDRSEWNIDNVLPSFKVLPPIVRKPAGRPKRQRIPSQGETVKSKKCGRCKQHGHNRQSCKNPIAIA